MPLRWLFLCLAAIGCSEEDAPVVPSPAARDASAPTPLPPPPVPDAEAPRVVTLTEPRAEAWVATRRVRLAGTASSATILLRIGSTERTVPVTAGAFEITLEPPAGVHDVTASAEGHAPARTRLHVGTEVAAGLSHSGALADGVPRAWGSNAEGQLGTTGDERATPMPITLGKARVTSLAFAAASSRSYALDAAGGIWTWGAGAAPALAATIPGAVHLTAGGGHLLAWTTTGELHALGANGAGQLGIGSTEPTAEATRVTSGIVSACGGSNHSAAAGDSGTLWTWGANDRGQLGIGAADGIAHVVPVAVPLTGVVTAVACGRDHTLARLADGSVWAWGVGSSGQLGHGASGNLADRVQPTLVEGLPRAAHVIAAANSSWAIDDEGNVWAWGQNSFGQLGVGTTGEKRRPAKVAALANVIGVAAGGVHAIFRTADGGTWTTGSNGSLQLGRTTGPSLAPELVTP